MDPRRYLAHLRLRSRLARKRWTRHVLFVAGGLCVGLAAITMAYLADQAQFVFGLVLAHSRYWAVLITPLGFAVCICLAIVVFPNSQGSGVPQVIAELRL
ncbi:MAG: putative H(+)/Cl(-) exchange transporter, partial [Marmoricola sp.]|nr:putative H(+)/Cl(-) exchange transporter [Marmoricola sp.]